MVTRQLTVGAREVRITSPVTPGFPTYATGLHRVEFEVLNPDPGFISPVIFYYVSDEPPGPPLGSLRLIAPFDRQHIHLLADALPEFTWEPARNGVVYHFQIYGLETPAGLQDLSRVDFSGKKPLVAALTKEPSYRISIFDFDRILPGIPYIWQVKAYDAGTGVAASLSRVVYFTAPDQTDSPSGQTKEGIPQAGRHRKTIGSWYMAAPRRVAPDITEYLRGPLIRPSHGMKYLIPFCIQDDTKAARRRRRRCTSCVHRGAFDAANEGAA